jgi:predicted nucleic acid-binding protein
MFPQVAAARRAAGRPATQFDAQIAAIARSRGAILATRNTSDFEHCGVAVLNPWIAR